MIKRAHFRQSLVGSYRDPSGREQPATLLLKGKKPALIPGLSGAIEVTGVLDVKGIVHEKPVTGRVLQSARSLVTRYELVVGDDWRLVGERRPRLTDPLYSSSTLHAKLIDASGMERAELVLRFDYRRELWRFLPT